jgi:hypothetical protein
LGFGHLEKETANHQQRANQSARYIIAVINCFLSDTNLATLDKSLPYFRLLPDLNKENNRKVIE